MRGALAGLDHGAVGEDDGEGDDPVLHRAVAVRVGARAAGADHAADLRARSWVRREEEPVFRELLVQPFPADGGLDDDVQILLVKLEDVVHPGEVDADPAPSRGEVTFQTRPARVSSHGDLSLVTHFHDRAHLLCAVRLQDDERLVLGQGRVRGPVRAGMAAEITLVRGYVLLANDVPEFYPRRLHIRRFRFVFDRWDATERRRGAVRRTRRIAEGS